MDPSHYCYDPVAVVVAILDGSFIGFVYIIMCWPGYSGTPLVRVEMCVLKLQQIL